MKAIARIAPCDNAWPTGVACRVEASRWSGAGMIIPSGNHVCDLVPIKKLTTHRVNQIAAHLQWRLEQGAQVPNVRVDTQRPRRLIAAVAQPVVDPRTARHSVRDVEL